MQVMIQEDGSELLLIHLTFKRGKEYERQEGSLMSKDSWGVACSPNAVKLHGTHERGPYQRSDDPRAVTCPMCIATELFREAMARQGQKAVI